MFSLLLADLRYAFRGLMARPLFAVISTASLALGIGVNTAMFSMFHQVVMQPLPVHEATRLVNLSAPGIKDGSTSNDSAGSRDDILSPPMLRDLMQQKPPQLTGIAGHRSISVTEEAAGQIRDGRLTLVTGNYFDLLGLRPALGRLLKDDDDRVGAEPVAVLTHRHWLEHYAGRQDVIGSRIRVNEQSLSIVGVAPAGFSGTSLGIRPELFVPLSMSSQLKSFPIDDRRSYWVYAFARLAPGTTAAEAQAALNLPYARLLSEVELPLNVEMDAQRQQEFAARRLLLSPGAQGQSATAAGVAGPIALLFGITGLVLLIACLNIANLLLARGAARASEFAIRASIGASRGRLLRQLLIEALLLASAGALISVPLAMAVATGMLGWLPHAASRVFDGSLSAYALAFTAVTALATVLLFGLFPALQLARSSPVAALSGAAGQAGTRSGNRFRAGLAMAQIAFSLASLILAGLFAKSLANINGEDLGMQVESLASFSVAPASRGYDAARMAALYDRLEEELARIPGVTAVTSSMVPLLANSDWGTNVGVEGYQASKDELSTSYNMVGVGFFDTLSIPLLAGRDFSWADREGAPKVAIVNRSFVERYGLPENPVGRRMTVGSKDDFDIEIVGLVADSKYSNVKIPQGPLFFLPRLQQDTRFSMYFYVRSGVAPETLLPQLAAVVAKIDPALPVKELRTLPQQIALTLMTERFVSWLSGIFAVLSTLLAALGLYGVLSYTLAQRSREIGLRLALGAAPRRLAAMLFRQLGIMTSIGALAGLSIAYVGGRAAQSLLFGLEGNDPAIFAGAVLLLCVIALVSGALPARRAARIDPMVALRHD